MPLLVYGVIRSSHQNLDSLADAARERGVDVVHKGPLAAVVHEIPEDVGLDDDDAEAYLESLVALLPGGPVLPVQFGTVAPDEDAVRREILEAGEEDLVPCLDKLEGLVEVRLSIAANAEAELERLFEIWPDMRRTVRAHGHDGDLEYRVELGREASVRLAERRDALSDRLLARLADRAEAFAHLAAFSVTQLRHAYLVRSEHLSAFDDEVRQLCEGLGEGYDVEYVGPLPAFDFTDVEVTQEEPSRWGW